MSESVISEGAALQALCSVIEELNEERDADEQLSTDPDAILYGEGGSLDSIDLVRLIVLYEQKLDEIGGCYVSITDDRAMSEEHSHFQTARRLAVYAARMVQEEASAG